MEGSPRFQAKRRSGWSFWNDWQNHHELAVNRILLDFHKDVATLRRELIINRLMERERNT